MNEKMQNYLSELLKNEIDNIINNKINDIIGSFNYKDIELEKLKESILLKILKLK